MRSPAHREAQRTVRRLRYCAPERALDRAKAADAEIARGLWRGPLHGVPIAVKDLCNTTFAPTRAGTTIFRTFTPSFNATVVERLEDGGAVLLGKLQMTEGAYTSHHPEVARAAQSMEHGLLGWLLLDRVGRRDIAGTLLRQPWQRHGRVDPVSVRYLRSQRDKADLGPRQPLRRVPARGDTGPCRADDAVRRRRRRHARRDRRRRQK